MPPIKKYDKEKVIATALKIAKKEGLDSLNARRIAKELNSSVNPIFNNFKNMDELKIAVYKKIYDIYLEYMNRDSNSKKAYKETGLNYIRFAKDYPEFFKIIFMQKTNLNAKSFITSDDAGNDVLKKGQALTGLDYETQKDFHVKVWIFTHGIACLVATKTINFSELEISNLLEATVKEMLIGFKERKNNEKDN